MAGDGNGSRCHGRVFAHLTAAGALCVFLVASLTVAVPAAAADQLAGQVGAERITTAELERRLAPELQRLRNEDYELRRQALDALIDERMLQQEAARRKVSVDALLQAEVRDLIAVTPEEIDAVYEMNREQISRSREAVEPEIRAYLQQQEEAAATRAFLARLGDRYPVQRFLEPPRTKVAADGFPARGKANAPVTIVEFSDFECPYCARLQAPLRQVLDRYGDQVRLVYRHFPLDIHPFAPKVAEASMCAHDQGQFWVMHDALFALQGALDLSQLRRIAGDVGLDAGDFNACLDSNRHAAAVAADLKAGEKAGVNGTPTLFINGRFINGAVPYETLVTVIDEELGSVRP